MEIIEKTGNSVQAAIDAGLEELGVGPADVMVEVLEESDQGIMGEGGHPARVRLILMVARDMPPPKTYEEVVEETTLKPNMGRQQPKRQRAPETAFDDADKVAQVGKELLAELLDHMGIEGEISIHKTESNRSGEGEHWVLNIDGDKVNRIIGRRGDTLACVQYLVRLMVSRRLQARANIVVDAADYKLRRSDRLIQMANRMADQAISQNRTITLEPMPPHERRIIHLALRHREGIETKSIGEGETRKVTIAPDL